MKVLEQKTKVSRSKRQELVNKLRENIARGLWEPGDMIGSEQALSKQFEVSRGTVRQALSSLEKEDILVRLPGRGTFVRESRSGIEEISNLVILVDTTTGLNNNFCLLEILDGLREVASEVGLLESLNIKFLKYENMDQCMPRIKSCIEGADGVLTISFLAGFADSVSAVIGRDIPCVNFFRAATQPRISQIAVDQAEGMRRAVNYLIQLGHRKVGLVIASGCNNSRPRLAGYREAFEATEVGFDPSTIIEVPVAEYGVRHNVEHFLHVNSDCTALIVGGGMLTHPVLEAINGLGKTIPGDLSVIAFDDTYETKIYSPPLSVMKQPLFSGVRSAFQKVVSTARGMLPNVPKTELMPPELIIRESCKSV